MLAKWLVNLQYSGSIEDYYTLPEKYLYAKIAVAAGASRSESDYISLPDRYVWSDIYKAVSGSSADTIDRGEKEAIGWIAAAVRGDTGNPQAVATYINWPWRYQVASIITALAVDADAQSFITTSGATDVEGIDQFVKGVKNLGLWDSMVCWPLRSSQNASFGDTVHSLGGLGTFNGTMTNGPVRAADGMEFTSTNSRYIALNSQIVAGNSAHTLMAVGQRTSSAEPFPTTIHIGNTRGSVIHGASTQNQLVMYRWDVVGVDRRPEQYVAGALSRFAAFTSGSSTSAKGYMNSGTPFYTFTDYDYRIDPAQDRRASIGGWQPNNSSAFDNFWDGSLAATAVWSVQLSDAQVASLLTTYKETLGNGLGLP